MRITTKELFKKTHIIDVIVTALRNGGLIAYPTDTVYGLGCDAFNTAAIDRLYHIKRRKRQNPMSIICSDLMDIHRYAMIPGFAYQLIRAHLPGPYTFILPLKNPLLKPLLGNHTQVAIRLPKNQLCMEIVRRLGRPLVSTSANVTHQPVIDSPENIEKTFSAHLEYIIDAGKLSSEPSSVIDLTKDVPHVAREGKGDLSRFI